MTSRPCEVCAGTAFTTLFRKHDHDCTRCRRCGLIRIDPQPSDATLARIYSASYFDGWGARESLEISRSIKRVTFRTLLRALPLRPGARILDCGAAFGFLMEEAAELGYVPYGIELEPNAARSLRERFGDCRTYCGPFEEAVFAGADDEPFDCVCMCDFIEHVRSPQAVLEKGASLLGPNGLLVITTPDAGSLSRRVLGASWPHFQLEHLFYFGRQNLSALLDRIGFEVTATGPAIKVLSLEYLGRQIETRASTAFDRLACRTIAMLTPSIRQRPMRLPSGQMVVVARKRPAEARNDGGAGVRASVAVWPQGGATVRA
jgi:2-polyprenyl-3-methyl-5-hydroxy-6-metoxy-1,4-benzoquinol methylase